MTCPHIVRAFFASETFEVNVIFFVVDNARQLIMPLVKREDILPAVFRRDVFTNEAMQ
jgi:hypothetical protein